MSAVLDARPALDTRALRQTLGRFATGITVISARSDDGAEAAITANSFNSLSLDPPLVLWSVARHALSAPIFQRATQFVVHVLAQEQRDISTHFARQQADKLAGVTHSRDALGGLVLPGSLARLVCEPHECVEAGDHWLFIARVTWIGHTEQKPLLYFAGSYQTLKPEMPGWRAELGDWVF
jgi:4-hydroxyphenylacetate 3-hydroxylase, reductase component